MSSNNSIPEPPKLSSANSLMGKNDTANVTPVEEALPEAPATGVNKEETLEVKIPTPKEGYITIADLGNIPTPALDKGTSPEEVKEENVSPITDADSASTSEAEIDTNEEEEVDSLDRYEAPLGIISLGDDGSLSLSEPSSYDEEDTFEPSAAALLVDEEDSGFIPVAVNKSVEDEDGGEELVEVASVTPDIEEKEDEDSISVVSLEEDEEKEPFNEATLIIPVSSATTVIRAEDKHSASEPTKEDSSLKETFKEVAEELQSEESEGTTGVSNEPVSVDHESSDKDTEAKVTEDVADDDENHTPWAIIKHTGYVTTSVWALLTAAATGVAGYFLAPGDFTWIAFAVLGFMTGVIAAVDRKTHLIKNQHTILTAVLTVPLAGWVALTLGSWNLLFGIIAAVLVFGVFLYLVIQKNFGSGGDIKFSPVPAFVLGVVNPLISAIWLFYAMVITIIILVIRKEKSTSFGEGMAIALPLAIASVYGLYMLAGLPYMEPVTP